MAGIVDNPGGLNGPSLKNGDYGRPPRANRASGTMRFNPKAKLDTSQVVDQRAMTTPIADAMNTLAKVRADAKTARVKILYERSKQPGGPKPKRM